VAGIVKKLDRDVIPRWRSFEDSTAKGELAFPRKKPVESEDFLADKRLAWEHNRTIWHASDFMGAAAALRRPSEARDAADFILRSPTAPAPALRIANKIVGSAQQPSPAISNSLDIRAEINRRRHNVHEDPRNAIQWIELARDYTVAGHRAQADRAIRIALNLNRENRFILRSAARFYIHDSQHDLAHYILRTAPNSKKDPWLVAAEIAVASATGASSRLIDFGRKMLREGDHAPFQVTELASALATEELANGKSRSARDLFKRSLLEPTENSLAQAEWASDQVKGLNVEVGRYDVAGKFEAAAWEYFNNGSWELSLANSRAWLADQAFSSRPAMLASYLMLCINEDYLEGIRLLENSIKANPGNPVLLNNLAFGLAMLNKPDTADKKIAEIHFDTLTKFDKAVVTATKGLIAYRAGNITLGRSRYLDALKIAKELGDQKLQAEALVYFAQEELRARTPDAIETLSQTLQAVDKYQEPKMKKLAELLRRKSRKLADHVSL
jgi:hypothetical protein